MALNETLNDGGFQTGSSGGAIDGAYYVFDTVEHEKPVGSAKANNADGTPAGGAYVRMPEKVSVKIKARTGIKAPRPMFPFRASFSGEAEKNWVITSVKIASSNEGASIRTYSADIEEFINDIPSVLST